MEEFIKRKDDSKMTYDEALFIIIKWLAKNIEKHNYQDLPDGAGYYNLVDTLEFLESVPDFIKSRGGVLAIIDELDKKPKPRKHVANDWRDRIPPSNWIEF